MLMNFHLQISATAKQLDSVTTVMNELEQKEQVYQTAISNVEKEINLRQQALELHRKKALECAQAASELKLNLGKDGSLKFYNYLKLVENMVRLISPF